MQKLICSLALCLLTAPAYAAITSDHKDGLETIHDVEIGSVNGTTLHVEILRPDPMPAGVLPAVLWIHGGAWLYGSQKDFSWSHGLAARGYVVVSVEYRMANHAKWPAQIEDCRMALRWLRANAAMYQVDPKHIGAWGHSAGAQLASILGLYGDEHSYKGESKAFAGVSNAVQAVVDESGPTDMIGTVTAYNGSDVGPLTGLVGASYQQDKKGWEDVNPILHITAKAPPFLVVHGELDEKVPFQESEHFAAALKAAGVPVKFIPVKGANHHYGSVDKANPASPTIKQLLDIITDFFDKTLKGK
jgi:acetyl esterase/lipase